MSATIQFSDEVARTSWERRVIRKAGGTRSVHVHSMIGDLAKEMTLTMYENVMSNNEVYAEWKRKHPGAGELALQASFVRHYWRSHVAAARATLAAMLTQPSCSHLHSGIHEALVLDNTLLRGRNPGVAGNG